MGNGQGRGQLILILGILSLICSCFPIGIVACVMGASDLKKISAGIIPESEAPMTHIGIILGIISVVLSIIGASVYLLLWATARGGV